jgi:hypothetical protein
MAADPTRDLLVAALRRFRRMSGDFGKERMAADDVLRDWVGEGDLDQAWSVISQVVTQYQHDVDSDVFTFFVTCGWQTPGDTLDARLKVYAAQHHVDERTALRRSDRGVVKVAQILRNRLVHDRPFAQLLVVQNGPFAHASITVHVEEGGDWRRPQVHVNGQRHTELRFDPDRPGLRDGYLSSTERLSNLPLDLASGYAGSLLSIRVHWPMPIWPAWDLASNIIDEQLYAQLTVDKDGLAEVRICWFGNAAESRQLPLRSIFATSGRSEFFASEGGQNS